MAERERPFEIEVDELAVGIEAAKRESVSRIRIRGYHLSNVPQHLSFEGLAGENTITAVSIGEDVKVASLDPTGLYASENLRELAYHDKRVLLDFSLLPRLETLHARYNENFDRLGHLAALRDLLIVSPTTPDCRLLAEASELTRLRISGGKLRSLAGIESLGRLSYLGLDHLPHLVDASQIGELGALTELRVEKCRELTDFSFLAGARSLRKIFLSDVASLEFVRSLPELEDLVFWNLIDGDFAPVFDSPSLTDLYFYPNKRHYPMKVEEARARLAEVRSAG